MRTSLLVIALLLSGCATAADSTLTAAPADSAAADTLDVRTWADGSDAVLLGTVTAIDYRMSLPQSNGIPLPFTFVTVSVERAWSGAAPGDSVTLRLWGGPTPDGGVMVNSEQPIFQVGDRDVLFVKANDVSGVPFYKGSFSRLRLVEGAAYDNEGDAILVGADGALGRGEWHELPGLNVLDIGGRMFEQNVDRLANPDAAPAVSESALLSALDQQLEGLAVAGHVVSSDPDAPVSFDVAGMTAAANAARGDTAAMLAWAAAHPLPAQDHK